MASSSYVKSGERAGLRERVVSFLDKTIPLDGASHADVVEYCVKIPMRYAECFAVLADGRTVGLENKCRFVGWSRQSPIRSFLFSNDKERFELLIDTRHTSSPCGCIRDIAFESAAGRAKQFIGVDGELIPVGVPQ